jgi:Transposase DDE domain group 1
VARAFSLPLPASAVPCRHRGRSSPLAVAHSCHAFRYNAVRLQLHALACNLAQFLRSLALPKEVEQWSLTTLREKLVKIGAHIVRHGRYLVSSSPRWRCRAPCSPRSCAGSTACEDHLLRWPDRSEAWGSRSRRESHAPNMGDRDESSRTGLRTDPRGFSRSESRCQMHAQIDQGSAEEQCPGCRPSPSGEYRLKHTRTADRGRRSNDLPDNEVKKTAQPPLRSVTTSAGRYQTRTEGSYGRRLKAACTTPRIERGYHLFQSHRWIASPAMLPGSWPRACPIMISWRQASTAIVPCRMVFQRRSGRRSSPPSRRHRGCCWTSAPAPGGSGCRLWQRATTMSASTCRSGCYGSSRGEAVHTIAAHRVWYRRTASAYRFVTRLSTLSC